MKLFKNFGIDIDNIKEDNLPIFKEWAYDFIKNEFLIKNGAYYLVSKNEALKIWIYKALKTNRYFYEAYSKKYGCEILKAVGISLDKNIEKSEIERYVEEALLVNPYIREVKNFDFDNKGNKIVIKFDVVTIYGDFRYEDGGIYGY